MAIEKSDNSIVTAFKLYENLSHVLGKKLSQNNKLTGLFLATKQKGFEFIEKDSHKGRIKSLIAAIKRIFVKNKDDLSFDKNIQQLAVLFENVYNATDEQFEEAAKAIQQESGPESSKSHISSQEIRKSINTLAQYLNSQKEHVEASRARRNISTERIKGISIPVGVSKKTATVSNAFFSKAKTFRENTVKEALVKAKSCFKQEFSPTELQTIVSFLDTYVETPALLAALEKSDVSLLHLAMLKALSFSAESRVDTYLKIIDNINPAKNNQSAVAPTGDPLALKNFGMVFGDSFLRESGLERENTKTEYVDMVAKFLKEKEHMVVGAKALHHTLSNRINLDDPIAPEDLRKEIKKKLELSTQTPKKCLLVGGWKNNGLIYEVERQKNGKLTFRIYNEGEGVEYQDKVQKGNKQKYAGCIAVKDIPEKLLVRKSFLSTLQGIAKLDAEGIGGVKPIELLVGHALPMLGGVRETASDRIQHFLSPSLSGTGPYRSTLAFLAHSMSPAEYKLIKFDFKMQLLEQYYPQLEAAAGAAVDAQNYEERLLELSTIRRSIEKFAGGVYKLKGSIFPDRIDEAQAKILQFQHQLTKLERGILKYEKSLYTNESLARMINSWSYAAAPQIAPYRASENYDNKHSEGLLSQQAYRVSMYQKTLENIEKIPEDQDSKEYSTHVETCLANVASIVTNPTLTEEDKLLVGRKFMQKLGAIQAWDKLKFTSPAASQKQLKNLVDQFGGIIHQSYVDHKAEVVCLFFSFCYALEKATLQLPVESQVLNEAYQSMVNFEPNQRLISKLRTSDPFLVDYIQGIKALPRDNPLPSVLESSDFTTVASSRDPVFFWLNEHVGTQIWQWWENTPTNKLLRQVMKVSIEADRAVQKVAIEAVKEEIKQLEVRYSQQLRHLEDQLRFSYANNYGQLQRQIQEYVWAINSLPRLEAEKIKAIEMDPQYWPKGFENSDKLPAYKGSFLFALQPDFIARKFSYNHVNRVFQSPPKGMPQEEVQEALAKCRQIQHSGDLLPVEFRRFCQTALLCENIRDKSARDVPVLDFITDREEGGRTLSLTPANPKSFASFKSKKATVAPQKIGGVNYYVWGRQYEYEVAEITSKSQLDKNEYEEELSEDPYHKEIKDPSIGGIYKDVVVNSSYTETHEPAKAQILAEKKAGIDLANDKIREIYSLRAEDNIKIDALLTYFQENISDLNDTNWLQVFHSFLFDSNLLLKELQNPKTAPLLIAKFQDFFQKSIDNALGLEEYATAANLFWIGANIQDYVDYISAKREPGDEKPLGAVIDKTKIFAIVDQAAQPKNEKQWPAVFEAALASCTHLLKEQKVSDASDIEFSKKLLGYAWTAHLMSRQVQVEHPVVPRKEDAGRSVQLMNQLLGENSRSFLETDLPKLLNSTVATHLARLYPSLPQPLEFVHAHEDIFRTKSGVEISLINGEIIPPDENLLKVCNKPLPDWASEYLAEQQLYESIEEVRQLRCFLKDEVVYIKDKKKNLEMQMSSHSNGVKILVKLPFDQANKSYLFNAEKDKAKYMGFNHELRENFHHFTEGNNTYLCDRTSFKPLYVSKKDGIYKVDAQGRPQRHEKLISFKQSQTLFSTFEDPSCTLCWGEREINEIEFPRLDLSFKRDGKKWNLAQQEGWSLAEDDQFVPHFGQKTGFLVVENSAKQRKVLFPVWDTHTEKERALNFPFTYDFRGEETRKGRFVECRIEGNQLVPNSLEARYYLAGLYLEKGRLDQAENLLYAIEAEVSHKELQSEEKNLLLSIIEKKSGDIGSRTLRMQARALYLLEKNRAQFPTETKASDKKLDINGTKLMEDYCARLAHIKPLDPKEELWILKGIQKRMELSPVLQMRWNLLNGTSENAESSAAASVLLVKASLSAAYKQIQTSHAYAQAADTTFMNKLRYFISRLSNTFPFDTKNPTADVLMRYLPLIEVEVFKGLTWDKARKNGMLQALYSLALFAKDSPNLQQFMPTVLSLTQAIEPPDFAKMAAVNSTKKSRQMGALQAVTGPAKSKLEERLLPGIQDLVVVTDLKASPDENAYLKGVADAYLTPVPVEGNAAIASESLFNPAAPEIVDETSKQQFALCRADLAAAQKRPSEVGYKLKELGEATMLINKLSEKVVSESQVLAELEKTITGAVNSALRFTPLADLSFISRKRNLPSIQTLCILCSKKDPDNVIRKVYPEISDEGLKNLKDAVKQYLIQKQFVQHLQRVVMQSNEVVQDTAEDPEVIKMLQDALGKSLMAERTYSLDHPKALIFLVLETMLNIKFRDDQVKNIEKFADGIAADKEVVLQMIMGAGKTSVLQPLLSFLLADSKTLSTVIVPDALFEPVKDGLSKVLGEAYELLAVTMPYDRQLAKDPAYLETFLDTLKDTKEKGATLLLTPRQKHSIITSLYEVYSEIHQKRVTESTYKREELITQISHFLQIHEVDQIDEIDLVMNSQVIFKYPIGDKATIDLQRASFLGDLMLSLSMDKEMSDTVSLDFIQAFKARKGEAAAPQAATLTKELFTDVVQPKLVTKTIELLKTKAAVFKKIFSEEASGGVGNKAYTYISHFLKSSTPFDEQIQVLCLPADEVKIDSELRGLSHAKLQELAKADMGSVKQLIAEKILFQQATLEWIKANIKDKQDLDLLGVSALAITQILSKSLFKECGAHYGLDPKKGAYIARPYDAPKSPKKTMYKSPYEQVIYSIQQLLYYGIPEDAAAKILIKYQEDAKAEMRINHTPLTETAAYVTLRKILGDELDNFTFLESPPSDAFQAAFHKLASQDEGILKEFLNGFAFGQISLYDQSLSSTPQAMVGSSRLAGGYTGTLHEGVLSRTMEATPEIGTDARTISAVQSKMVSGDATTEVFSPKVGQTCLSMMIDKFKADENLFVFIDSGGWLKEENIHSYALKVLTEAKKARPELEGIIYHNEKGAKISLELDPSSGKFIVVPQALSRLQSNGGKQLTIIGQKYETGTNIPQKANAKAYMSVRKNMTLRDGLQSIFRMRQILVKQSLSFALTEEVANHIAAGVMDGLVLNPAVRGLFALGKKLTMNEVRKVLATLDYDAELKASLLSSFEEFLKATTQAEIKEPVKQRDFILKFSGIFKTKLNIKSDSVWRYFTVNKAHAEQEKNWLAGKQKMKEVIEKPIRMVLSDPNFTPKERRKLFAEFADFLIETSIDSPFKNFTGQGQLVAASQARDAEVERYLKFILRLKNSALAGKVAEKVEKNMADLYSPKDSSLPLEVVLKDTLENCVKLEDIPELIMMGEADSEQEIEQESEVEQEQERTIEQEVQVEIQMEQARLDEKAYLSLTTQYFDTASGPVMNAAALFSQHSATIEPLRKVIPNSIAALFQDVDHIEYSKNLFIDGAKLGSATHGQYHLAGRYILAISNTAGAQPTRYVLVSHEDAGKLKEGMLHVDIHPPQALSLLSFDGAVSTSTDRATAIKYKQDEQFKRIAVYAKICTGKLNYSKAEINMLRQMLHESDNPQKSVRELETFYQDIIKYLPGVARKYPGSGLQRLFAEFSQ